MRPRARLVALERSARAAGGAGKPWPRRASGWTRPEPHPRLVHLHLPAAFARCQRLRRRPQGDQGTTASGAGQRPWLRPVATPGPGGCARAVARPSRAARDLQLPWPVRCQLRRQPAAPRRRVLRRQRRSGCAAEQLAVHRRWRGQRLPAPGLDLQPATDRRRAPGGTGGALRRRAGSAGDALPGPGSWRRHAVGLPPGAHRPGAAGWPGVAHRPRRRPLPTVADAAGHAVPQPLPAGRWQLHQPGADGCRRPGPGAIPRRLAGRPRLPRSAAQRLRLPRRQRAAASGAAQCCAGPARGSGGRSGRTGA
ncbi:hypothetical protein FQZ97_697610 [compost metagenome]